MHLALYNPPKIPTLTESGGVSVSAFNQAIAEVTDKAEAAQNTANGKANPSGTYANLRAQATTKADVGLSNVGNYGKSDSVSSTSSTVYATSKAVKTAYDRGTDARTRAINAQSKADAAHDLASNAKLKDTTLWSGSTTASSSGSTITVANITAYTLLSFEVAITGAGDVQRRISVSVPVSALRATSESFHVGHGEGSSTFGVHLKAQRVSDTQIKITKSGTQWGAAIKAIRGHY